MGFTAIEGSLWKPASGVRVTTCPGAGASFIGTGLAEGAVGSCALALTAKKITAATYRTIRRRYSVLIGTRSFACGIACRLSPDYTPNAVGFQKEGKQVSGVNYSFPSTTIRSPDGYN